MWELQLHPESASKIASSVDSLFLFLLVVSAFFTVLIVTLVIVFAIKYRRRPERKSVQIRGDLRLEILWTVIPLILSMVMFGWGAKLYMIQARAPADAEEVYVVGKQWMWKIQHLNGPREINELHVPVGVPIRLTLTSEDVIHSFFVPAFRMKKDAVPGRYNTTWFEAKKPGEYHLFCAEYCGTGHSTMIGHVIVMEPHEYEDWLSGGVSGQSLAEAGEKLFTRLACHTCHGGKPTDRGPPLTGLVGSTVRLTGGRTVKANETYIRESILEPKKKVVEGYEPIMPTYKGQLSEEDLIKIIAYLKTKTKPEGKR